MCPYKKINLQKIVCDNYKQEILKRDERISDLLRKLNDADAKLKIFSNAIHNSQILLKPVFENFEPIDFKIIINSSYWSDQVKEETLKLFKNYEDYCFNNDKKKYEIDTAFIYLKEVKKYKSNTFRHRLRLFIRIFKKSLKDNFIQPSFFYGGKEPAKIKHLVTLKEINNLMIYLKKNNNLQLWIVFETLYKFGVRIGSISRLKVSDYNPSEKLVIFREKNNKIIQRRILKGLSERIEFMIKVFNLRSNDFLFYKNILKSNLKRRRLFFSNIIIKTIKSSNAFHINSVECFSSHMFRASLATRLTLLNGIGTAKETLNHSSHITTLNSYVRPEERGLNINQEEEMACTSKKMLKKKRLKLLNKKISKPNSLEYERELSDDEDSSESCYEDSNYYDEDEEIDEFNLNLNEFNNSASQDTFQVEDLEELEELQNRSQEINKNKSANINIEEKKHLKSRFSKVNRKKFSKIKKVLLENKKEENKTVKNISSRSLIEKDNLKIWQTVVESKRKLNKFEDINKSLKLKINKQINKPKDEENKNKFYEILLSTGRRFTDDILVKDEKMYNYANESKVVIQEINGNNLNIYQQYKSITLQGLYPNLYLKKINEIKGYGVFAYNPIKAGTLICEYAGFLDYLKNLKDTKDLFTLFKTKKADYDRVINPEKFCNIARFINCSDNINEDNCGTIRILVNNQAKILIYSNKNIKINEELLYNYNGLSNDYFY